MSNPMSDDYFSFMSEKWDKKDGPGRSSSPLVAAARIPPSVKPTDIIDFKSEDEESQIEVTESEVSDTAIQRIFKFWRKDPGSA